VGLLLQGVAVVLRVPAGENGGGFRRRAHLRLRHRDPRGRKHGCDDGGLGEAAARAAAQGLEPDHERSARRGSRGLRYQFQAARDDRMGVVPVDHRAFLATGYPPTSLSMTSFPLRLVTMACAALVLPITLRA